MTALAMGSCTRLQCSEVSTKRSDMVVAQSGYTGSRGGSCVVDADLRVQRSKAFSWLGNGLEC